MKVTDAIAVEHAILLRVFEQVEGVLPRLGSVAEVGTMATILEGLLRTHAQMEVNFAFVALDHALEHKGRLGTLHRDHRELDDRLRHVQESPTCELARGRLRVAMRASREHFRKEERELFPVLERALGLGELAALGEAFKKATKSKASEAPSLGGSSVRLDNAAPPSQ